MGVGPLRRNLDRELVQTEALDADRIAQYPEEPDLDLELRHGNERGDPLLRPTGKAHGKAVAHGPEAWEEDQPGKEPELQLLESNVVETLLEKRDDFVPRRGCKAGDPKPRREGDEKSETGESRSESDEDAVAFGSVHEKGFLSRQNYRPKGPRAKTLDLAA
jgi:hypothetical protein